MAFVRFTLKYLFKPPLRHLFNSSSYYKFSASYYSSFQVYLKDIIRHLLLYSIFFTIVYIPNPFILRVVFSLISISILSVPYLLRIYALAIFLLLAFIVLLDLDSVVVQLGFVLEAIYNYYFTSYYYLYLLGQQVNY